MLDAVFVSAENLIESPASMAAVNNDAALAPAVNAATAAIVATTAVAAAQAFDASVASNWQSGGQFVSIGLSNGAGQRTAAQLASAQLGDAMSFAPRLLSDSTRLHCILPAPPPTMASCPRY